MNEVKKAIATYGLTNTGGISIYKINYIEDTISFQVITDKVIDDVTVPIEWITVYEDGIELPTQVNPTFKYGSMVIQLNECIRVN